MSVGPFPSSEVVPDADRPGGYTISIVSHGHGPLLTRALAQIATFSPPPDLVVITLNLKAEPFDATGFASHNLQVIRNESPKGFGANHNAAFTHCRSPWFAVLNPDLKFDFGNPFESLVSLAGGLPQVGLVAPRIFGAGGAAEDAVRDNLTPWSLVKRAVLRQREPVEAPDFIRRPGKFHWLAGMFMLLDAAAFRHIDGFDERFFLYCEDFDLCARLYWAGFGLATDSRSAVVHDAQRDSHRSLRHFAWHLSSLTRVWLSAAFWRVLLQNAAPSRRRA